MLLATAGVAQASTIWSAPASSQTYYEGDRWAGTTQNLQSLQQGQTSLTLSMDIRISGPWNADAYNHTGLVPGYFLVGGTGSTTPLVGYDNLVNSPKYTTGEADGTFTNYTLSMPVTLKSSGVYSFYAFSLSDDFGYGKWNMLGAKLTSTDKPAATPIPAAVWLLGSGLMGLVGMGKKLKA